MTARLPETLVLAGAGKMGGALLEGWLDAGLPGRAITVLDPNASPALAARCRAVGIALNPDGATIAAPDALVLAVKPQQLADAAPALNALCGPATFVVSILAGKTIDDLRARLPGAGAIARAMPNLPASVGRAVTAVTADPRVTEGQKEQIVALLAGVGQVEWLPGEHLIDAVTAVSGSGPAYVFFLVECLARAGAAAGLPDDLALRLARGTVAGAGEMLYRSDLSPTELRQNVTSPGGTTAAALAELTRADAMALLLERAVAAAKRRAGELSS